jgi:small subunit ribosomal protein S15
MLNKEEKQKIISKYEVQAKNTGSPEVQIALLTSRIQVLQKHFESHKKDFHSKRGLLGLVSKRKKMLNYLKRKNNDHYVKLINSLDLRG